MENAIVVENLSHRFDERYVLQNLSYEVKQGEVFALLGPNGAGKTTTIHLLNGLYQPTSGSIRVLGDNPVVNGRGSASKQGYSPRPMHSMNV